jgi:hypothetical protein
MRAIVLAWLASPAQMPVKWPLKVSPHAVSGAPAEIQRGIIHRNRRKCTRFKRQIPTSAQDSPA